MQIRRKRKNSEKGERYTRRKCSVGRVFCSMFLLLLAVLIGFPVWVAVTGVFMQQWELTEYLGRCWLAEPGLLPGHCCHTRRRFSG